MICIHEVRGSIPRSSTIYSRRTCSPALKALFLFVESKISALKAQEYCLVKYFKSMIFKCFSDLD